MDTASPFKLRVATPADMPALLNLHACAWTELGGAHYTAAQLEGVMADFVTVDPDLIGGGTYYVIEQSNRLVASGGWTTREQVADKDRQIFPAQSTPVGASATIRAVFTDPGHARRGLARKIMAHAERKASTQGNVARFGLTATLTGLPFYSSIGYRAEKRVTICLSNGEAIEAVAMSKAADRVCLLPGGSLQIVPASG